MSSDTSYPTITLERQSLSELFDKFNDMVANLKPNAYRNAMGEMVALEDVKAGDWIVVLETNTTVRIGGNNSSPTTIKEDKDV